MKKGFAQVAILLIVLAVSAGALIYQVKNQKPAPDVPSTSTVIQDPYRTWKTYKNKTYGFTIRYPKQWFVKEYQDYAASFYNADPKEATPGAKKVSFLKTQETQDLAEFEKIRKAEINKEIWEPLDVKSIITKIRNLEIGNNPAVEYQINRNFSALEGPRGEHRHIYEINKDGTVIRFLTTAQTESEYKIFDPIFEKMISSIKF